MNPWKIHIGKPLPFKRGKYPVSLRSGVHLGFLVRVQKGGASDTWDAKAPAAHLGNYGLQRDAASALQ